jgi:hypothetical protein
MVERKTDRGAGKVTQDIIDLMKSRRFRVVGCTQKEIADELGCSVGTVSRYLKVMLADRRVHYHGSAKWKNGVVSGATYKHGPDPNAPPPPPVRPRREYKDIPLAFFGVKTK